MSNLLSALREFDALRDGESGGDLVQRRVLEPISPTYTDASISEVLGDQLVKALHKAGIERFYQHQSEGIRHALDGANVVLQAPTASGKTLTFQIPMLKALLEPGAHALMIYPTKALALDQREQLLRLTKEMPEHGIESWWYDGDTDNKTRKILRERPPHILITNPDMLHNSFLGHSSLWAKFFKGLKFVIVDEIHEYRGYFGSNVAMLLRRFSYHLASIGVRPQFFLCSATCANAKEHAINLTGLDFVEVKSDRGLRPKREFLFIKPDIPDHNYWDILQLRTVRAGLACVKQGKTVLAFCPTRKFAETCIKTANRELEKHSDTGQPLVHPESVKVFRSGLLVEERHEIQEGLKRGDVKLVFTTNALEMGIDIGGLDGVILSGFPDSLMSAWQRIGRAGRNWQSDAFVMYFARNNPLDRFYATNLDTCLSKPLDDLVVNPENEDLVTKHLACVLYETPLLNDAVAILGKTMETKVLEADSDGGALPNPGGKWRPHSGLNIRGGGAGIYTLMKGNQEIGTISGHHQFREAPLGAIYMHGGQSYRVEEVSFTSSSGGEIRLESVDPWLRSNIAIFTNLSIQDIFAGWRWIGDKGIDVSVFYGKVSIVESLASVQNVNEKTGEVVDVSTPHKPAQFKDAHAFWLKWQTLVPDSASAICASAPAINALQHLFRIGALFSIPLDSHDIFPYAVSGDQIVYIVESYPGGIGVTNKLLAKWRQVLSVGIRIAADCECNHGCPNCIVPPRSTDEIEKTSAIECAQSLLSMTDRIADRVYNPTSRLWGSVA